MLVLAGVQVVDRAGFAVRPRRSRVAAVRPLALDIEAHRLTMTGRPAEKGEKGSGYITDEK